MNFKILKLMITDLLDTDHHLVQASIKCSMGFRTSILSRSITNSLIVNRKECGNIRLYISANELVNSGNKYKNICRALKNIENSYYKV